MQAAADCIPVVHLVHLLPSHMRSKLRNSNETPVSCTPEKDVPARAKDTLNFKERGVRVAQVESRAGVNDVKGAVSKWKEGVHVKDNMR
jgi:hypothetical protein